VYANEFYTNLLSFLQTPSLLKRAGTDKLREVFQKYASLQKDGEHYMTSEDFVRKFLGLFTDAAFNDVSINPVGIIGSLQGYIIHTHTVAASRIVISSRQQQQQ